MAELDLGPVIGLVMQDQGPRHRAADYKSYASPADKARTEAYNYNQRAKGGSIGYGGYNSRAAGDKGFQPLDWRAALAGGNAGKPGQGWAYPGAQGWRPQDRTAMSFNMNQGYQAPYQMVLGTPSPEFIEKYARWGAQGPVTDKGWKGTLRKAPASASTSAPTQKHKTEVFQTMETRKSDEPYQELVRHYANPNLNKALRHMFVAKNMDIGTVRRNTAIRTYQLR